MAQSLTGLPKQETTVVCWTLTGSGLLEGATGNVGFVGPRREAAVPWSPWGLSPITLSHFRVIPGFPTPLCELLDRFTLPVPPPPLLRAPG